MIARRAALAQLGIAATAVLTGCGIVGPWFPKYRFRLTVMIETPEGMRTGSSVYEVKTSRTGEWLPASPNQMGDEGDPPGNEFPGSIIEVGSNQLNLSFSKGLFS